MCKQIGTSTQSFWISEVNVVVFLRLDSFLFLELEALCEECDLGFGLTPNTQPDWTKSEIQG